MDNSNQNLKGLFPKLLHIQRKINGLGKNDKTHNYQYVTGSKVLDAIKPLMNEYGLLLKQEVVSIENDRQDYQTRNGSKSEILSKVMMRFTWIDVDSGERDENSFGANGQNDWEKGLGSALTYAERYFLLKYFHIATDKDDIDNKDRDTSDPVPVKKVLQKMDGKAMTKEWLALVKRITSKTLTDFAVIEDHFEVSEDIKTELTNLINTINNGSK